MKIHFIIPPHIHYIEPYAYVAADKSNAIRPSMGILYVAAALRQNLQINARVIDCNADGLSLDALAAMLKSESPDIVGLSALTFNLLNCMEVSKIVRENSPRTKICYGGWHPTLYPRETLELDCADFIVVGEGETTFSELVSIVQQNTHADPNELDKIKGLGYRASDGAIRINAPREVIKQLDDIPFPAYDLIDTGKYSNLLACSDQTVNIMTSRGCPQKCAFCDLRRTSYRFRTPANILAEIRFWVDKGVREFFIQDDNFTISRTRTLEFCRLLIEANLNIKYKISSRVDYMDDELVRQLKRSGCYRIYFGVESGSQKVLDYLDKGITVDQIKKAFHLANTYGIDSVAYIMIGAPYEQQEDIDETMRLVRKIRPRHLHCSVCTPMPKTHMYQKLLTEGLIKHDYWLDFARKPDPAFKTPFISQVFTSEELRSMQNSIQRRFYLSPRIIMQEILRTRSAKQFYAKAKMSLRVIFR